jgi:hypothetical protein
LNNTTTGLFVAPVREAPVDDYRLLMYSTTLNEVLYADASSNQSKTFVINHPVHNDRYLVHSCLEGPESGVYYRGIGHFEVNESEITIQLPNYVKYLASELTSVVTPVVKSNSTPYYLATSEVVDGEFTVFRYPIIEPKNLSTKSSFNWIVIGKRADIDVEPYKKDVTIKGDGPYRYI